MSGGWRPEASRARLAPALPRLHLVTDDRVLAAADFPARARTLLVEGGADIALHLRGPGSGGRRIHELAEALLPATQDAGALLLVNDRVDVALALGADGVHLGRRSLPVAEVRRVVEGFRSRASTPGRRLLVGASVHAREDAAEAAGEGADYLAVGTLYATASHPGRAGGGPQRLAAMARVTDLPLLGIGGITPERVPAVLVGGAHGVAVLSGVWQSADPVRMLERYRRALGPPNGAAKRPDGGAWSSGERGGRP